MAKVKTGENSWGPSKVKRKKKRTSIGRSKNSRPKNKGADKSKYRGQGR